MTITPRSRGRIRRSAASAPGELARTAVEAQQTDEPLAAARPDYLHAPLPGDRGAHGRFDDDAVARSPSATASRRGSPTADAADVEMAAVGRPGGRVGRRRHGHGRRVGDRVAGASPPLSVTSVPPVIDVEPLTPPSDALQALASVTAMTAQV